MVHAIYAFVQSKRSGATAEEQTNDGRKTEEVAPSVLRVVCPQYNFTVLFHLTY